jgi:hypothetical protein
VRARRFSPGPVIPSVIASTKSRLLSSPRLSAPIGGGRASIELAPDQRVELTPNLSFVGTVNVDETTHGFADKIYDRAQLIELDLPRDLVAQHLGATPYAVILRVWDAVRDIAPFAYRVLDEVRGYAQAAGSMDVVWQEAVDEQLLQKVLPKLKGSDPRLGEALQGIIEISANEFPLTQAKARLMLDRFQRHGFASGTLIATPTEWTPALIEVDAPLDAWHSIQLSIQETPVSVRIEHRFGRDRLLADWPRSSTGNSRLALKIGSNAEARVITIRPQKISETAYAAMIDDLQTRLPTSIAISLKKAGGLSGIHLIPPEEGTLAQELDSVVGRERPAVGLSCRGARCESLPRQTPAKRSGWRSSRAVTTAVLSSSSSREPLIFRALGTTASGLMWGSRSGRTGSFGRVAMRLPMSVVLRCVQNHTSGGTTSLCPAVCRHIAIWRPISTTASAGSWK